MPSQSRVTKLEHTSWCAQLAKIAVPRESVYPLTISLGHDQGVAWHNPRTTAKLSVGVFSSNTPVSSSSCPIERAVNESILDAAAPHIYPCTKQLQCAPGANHPFLHFCLQFSVGGGRIPTEKHPQLNSKECGSATLRRKSVGRSTFNEKFEKKRCKPTFSTTLVS